MPLLEFPNHFNNKSGNDLSYIFVTRYRKEKPEYSTILCRNSITARDFGSSHYMRVGEGGVDGNIARLGLGVHIADIDAAFVVEEHRVALAMAVEYSHYVVNMFLSLNSYSMYSIISINTCPGGLCSECAPVFELVFYVQYYLDKYVPRWLWSSVVMY
jgi:hypothetical protein